MDFSSHREVVVNETKTKGVQGRADFYAKLLQICAIFLALIGGGLAAQMKAGAYDMLFWVGAVLICRPAGCNRLLLCPNSPQYPKTGGIRMSKETMDILAALFLYGGGIVLLASMMFFSNPPRWFDDWLDEREEKREKRHAARKAARQKRKKPA